MRALRNLLATLVLAVAPLLAVAPASAQAGACSDTGARAHTLTGHLLFPRPDVNNFMAGQITHPNSVIVLAEAPVWDVLGRYQVCVRTPVSTLGNGKPIGDLQFYDNETGTWQSLRNEFTVVSTPSSFLQRAFTIPVRMVLNWETDRPGLYGPTPLIFHVSRR